MASLAGIEFCDFVGLGGLVFLRFVISDFRSKLQKTPAFAFPVVSGKQSSRPAGLHSLPTIRSSVVVVIKRRIQWLE